MSYDPDSLVLAKSIALIQKTKKRVEQVDNAEFPTQSSEQARLLLLGTLNALADKTFLPAMNPEALYNVLINIQGLVEQLEASDNAHISWPLVSCCDSLWNQLFTEGKAQIFYSVMTEHNYGISSFSFHLKRLIEKVLPPSQIKKILNGQILYCLQLASLEDENLPLYANIGHEFGHALFWSKDTVISELLASECAGVFKLIVEELNKIDPSLIQKRATKTSWIIRGFATELFCDLIGFLISGPAFFLSLHEMTWGMDQGVWSARLSPTYTNISAYPSFRFRFHGLRKLDRISSFEKESIKACKVLNKNIREEMATYLSKISTEHSSDNVDVSAFFDPDNDRGAIESAIKNNFVELKTALERFVTRCWNEFLTIDMKEKQFPPTSAEDVFQLLHRLENDILPNIIPNNTLYGVPASFSAILNASAIYRIYVLSICDKILITKYFTKTFRRWSG